MGYQLCQSNLTFLSSLEFCIHVYYKAFSVWFQLQLIGDDFISTQTPH